MAGSQPAIQAQTIFIPLSGFLGAGKTTLMLATAEQLRERGLTVACVTNDQGGLLIDSSMVERAGMPLGEVRGGCFCCKFDELLDTVRLIMAAHRPDVILAEAVGSCTDLTATVIRPLKQLHGELLQARPLTTVMDPLCLEEVLIGTDGNEEARGWSEEIRYIYRKQLEEAACLLINKMDLLTSEHLRRLEMSLGEAFPTALMMSVASRVGLGISDWLDLMLDPAMDALPSSTLDIDYRIYGDGEAQLGWLNASFSLEGALEDVVGWCEGFTLSLVNHMDDFHAHIGHVKLLAQDHAGQLKMSVTGSGDGVQTDLQPQECWSSDRVTVWLNARIQVGPETLREQVVHALEQATAAAGVTAVWHELECFAPSRPVPAYRIEGGAS